MPDVNFDGFPKIHLHCPYCWGEYTSFEQIGTSINFNNHMYEDFLIFPIESPSLYLRQAVFGKKQHIERIVCPTCGRMYTIILLPFKLAPEQPIPDHEGKRNVSFRQNIISVIDRYSSIDALLPKFTNWKAFLLFNWLLIFLTFSNLFTGNLILFTSFFLLLISEIVVIITLPSFSIFLKNAFDVQNMPLLFHKKYIESPFFIEFKKSFFENPAGELQNKELIQFLFIIIFIMLGGIFLSTAFISIVGSTNLINSILTVILIFGVFSLLFYICSFVLLFVPLLSNSLFYLQFVSRSIPFKIDPWEEPQKIEVFKQLWLWTFTICLFLLITVSIILEMNAIIDVLVGFIANKRLESILSAGGNLFIVLTAVTFFLIMLFIKIIYDLNMNIERRKIDLISQVKRELSSIKLLECPSNHDIFKGLLLVRKADKIRAISTFSVKQLIGFTITLTSLIAPMIFNIIRQILL